MSSISFIYVSFGGAKTELAVEFSAAKSPTSWWSEGRLGVGRSGCATGHNSEAGSDDFVRGG